MISSPKNHDAPIVPQPKFRILQVQSLDQFQQFATGILDLLSLYQSVLRDDFSDPNPAQLLRNTSTYAPWLWLLVEDLQEPHESMDAPGTENNTNASITEKLMSASPTVYGLASLSDIIPGRHAFLHGVAHPGIRRHPAVFGLGELVLRVAFNELKVHKVKAEIEAGNPGAQGYCRRMGFVREAHFKSDNRINGQWQDVLVYSLFAEQFYSRRKQE